MPRTKRSETEAGTGEIEAIYDESVNQWLFIEEGSEPSDGRYILIEYPTLIKR